MKKSILFLFLLLCMTLSACGYQTRGTEGFAKTSTSAFSSPDATVNIGSIEQSSMYPNVPYFITTTLRDEIAVRGLAKWKSIGESDYIINARLFSFDISSFEDNTIITSAISTASVRLELSLIDAKTGNEVINSGIIHYSENFENPREDDAIKEVIDGAVKRALNKFQSTF